MFALRCATKFVDGAIHDSAKLLLCTLMLSSGLGTVCSEKIGDEWPLFRAKTPLMSPFAKISLLPSADIATGNNLDQLLPETVFDVHDSPEFVEVKTE